MSNWGNLLLYDPRDLENMYANEDSLSELPTLWEDIQEESFADLSRVRDLLSLIPPREADFIELYFFKKVRQTSIAKIFNVSQPTICYRLRRGAARLKFLLDIQVYSPEEIENDLKAALKDPVDVTIMMGMLRTTCQSDVARELGVTQGFVRHRFIRSITTLGSSEEFKKYVGIFEMVRTNVNVLKNTNRAAWSEEVIYQMG